MKVGILTFHHVLNYGATLQAYALCEFLNQNGYNAEIIDYRPHAVVGQYKRIYYGRNPLRYPKFFVHCLRWRVFSKFWKKYYQRSPRKYKCPVDLQMNPPQADAYICGSDQIWNPALTGDDHSFFLDFGDERIRRVAYAPSFGDSLSEGLLNDLSSLLTRFDSISVREDSASEKMEQLLGRSIPCVADPTLLLDSYDSILKAPRVKKPYILGFYVYLPRSSQAILRAVSDTLGVRSYVVSDEWKFWKLAGHPIWAPDVGEWLGLIKNAEAVVSGSFHGTVFCILFERNFISQVPPDVYKQRSHSRVGTLLASLGLEERLLPCDASRQQVEDLLSAEINWKPVRERIKQLREESGTYLLQALMVDI